MSHTIKEKKKLLARVGRIRGQVEAIERALDHETECARIMHMIAGIRGSVAGLMAEVVEDHIRTHLVDPEQESRSAERRRRRPAHRRRPYLSEVKSP